MFNKRGEISTLVVVGVLSIIGVATLISSTQPGKRNTLLTRAEYDGTSCNDNVGDSLNSSGSTSFTINCSGNLNRAYSYVLFWCPDKSRGATYCGDPRDLNSNQAQVIETGGGAALPSSLSKSTNKTCGCVQWDVGVGGANAQDGVAGGAIICSDSPCGNTNPTQQPNQPTATRAPQNTPTNLPGQQNTPTLTSQCRFNNETLCVDNCGNNNCERVPGGGAQCYRCKSAATPTRGPNTTDGRCTYIGDVDCITLTPSPKLPNGTGCSIGNTCQSGCCANNLCNTASVCQSSCPNGDQTKCPGTNRCVDSQDQCSPTPTSNSVFLPIIQNNTQPSPTPTRTTLFLPIIGNNRTPTPTSLRCPFPNNNCSGNCDNSCFPVAGNPSCSECRSSGNEQNQTAQPTESRVVDTVTTDDATILVSCIQKHSSVLGVYLIPGCILEAKTGLDLGLD